MIKKDADQKYIHVFLETSILLETNWDLEWPPLQALLRRAGHDVMLHTTSITLWEILDVGNRYIRDAEQRFVNIKKYAKGPVPEIEWVNPALFRQRYQELCQFEHTGDGANLGDIVRLWLNQTPPFSEDKPPQFRDAMAFLSLHHWAESQRTAVYVVAKDPDWKNACSKFEWCICSDLGALVAALRAPIEFDEEQLAKLSDELEVRMVDALDGAEPQITNRPGRSYDVEVLQVYDMQISLFSAQSDSTSIFATFHFEAVAELNVSGRYGKEARCEPRIRGEVEIALDPGYRIQEMHVSKWSFELPDLKTMELRRIERSWIVDD